MKLKLTVNADKTVTVQGRRKRGRSGWDVTIPQTVKREGTEVADAISLALDVVKSGEKEDAS